MRPLTRASSGVLVALAFLCAGPVSASLGAVDHVDCQASAAGADGSEAHPWTTLADASAQPLAPAGQLLLKRGTTCEGTLTVSGSGTSASPALVGAYGTGSQMPVIVGAAPQAVRLDNTSYTTLEGLELTDPGDGSVKRRGVYVVATGQTVVGLTIRGLYIHDVGGNLDKDNDGSGGIQIDADGPGTGRFEDLTVALNRIERVSRSGIRIDGLSTGQTRPTSGQPWPDASTGVLVTGNRVDQIAGDGIVAVGTDGAVLSHNIVSNGNLAGRPILDPAGMICDAGIWTFNANGTVIEHNEVYGMKFNGCDGTGFDVDYMQDGTIVQFNYSHDNEGGFLLLCTDDQPRTAEVRFNLSVDDAFSLTSSPCSVETALGSYAGIDIHNNTIVAPDPGFGLLANPASALYGPQDINLFDNIFAATGTGRSFSCEPGCHNNLFFNMPAAGSANVVADPRFADGSRRGTPDTPEGFRLAPGSPAFQAGSAIPAGATNDYFGQPINRSVAPNIGFDQEPGMPDAGVTPPSLRRLALHPPAFRARRRRGPSVGKKGPRLRFTLDTAASVTFKVRVLRRGKARKRYGFFRVRGAAGSNVRHFTGRMRHRPLPPGRYRLTAVPRALGAAGPLTSTGFRVLRR